LHHFAFHLAREEAKDLRLMGRVALTDEDRQAMSAPVHTACASLFEAYQPYLDSSLLFDTETRALGKALVDGPHELSDARLRAALQECMPTYEKVFWPRHRSASEAMLDGLIAQLEKHEATMAEKFAAALAASWPDAPIRVDLSPYANWAGAYTDDAPAHITMSSLDKDIAGEFAFEILFHESGHTGSFAQAVRLATTDALASTGLQNNRFWHYVLFYVSGEVAFDVLGDPNYAPFSRATGLTDDEKAKDIYRAMAQTWGDCGTFHDKVLRAAERVVADSSIEAGDPGH
jgi:hypothetical protein